MIDNLKVVLVAVQATDKAEALTGLEVALADLEATLTEALADLETTQTEAIADLRTALIVTEILATLEETKTLTTEKTLVEGILKIDHQEILGETQHQEVQTDMVKKQNLAEAIAETTQEALVDLETDQTVEIDQEETSEETQEAQAETDLKETSTETHHQEILTEIQEVPVDSDQIAETDLKETSTETHHQEISEEDLIDTERKIQAKGLEETDQAEEVLHGRTVRSR